MESIELMPGYSDMVSPDASLVTHIRHVVAYYEETYLDYRLLWMNPSTLAMHFGYWDEQTHSHAEALLNMNRALATRADLRPGDRVLDAGCGVGGSAIWLAREFDVQVVGITLVPGQITRARRFAQRHGVAQRVTFDYQDFTHTTFLDGSFDVVWAIESVCHTPDKRDFLLEARRVLKPNGRLVVADWFRHRRPLSSADETLLHNWLSGWAVPDLMTADGFVSAARQACFAQVRLEDVTGNVRPSLRRLYRLALLGHPAAILLWALRLRTDNQLANARSALQQYQALKRNLWFYGMVTAA
jgi:tocopherol O-methyltransferase